MAKSKPQIFADTEFMSAADKAKVFRQWCNFLKKNLDRRCFSKALYLHLSLHCDFIAHTNLDGFWDYYFSEDREVTTLQFLDHFGVGGITGFWFRDERYIDLNQVMVAEMACHLLRLQRDVRERYQSRRTRQLELLAYELGYDLHKGEDKNAAL